MAELRRVKTWYGWTVVPINPEPEWRKVQGDELRPATQTPEATLKARPLQKAVHGTRRRYAKGCRCEDCSRRESEYRAEWRLRTGRSKKSTVLGESR